MTWGTTIPDRAGFHAAAQKDRSVPIVRRLLAEDLTPTAVYGAFGGRPGTFILESAEHGAWGRWSFVGVNCQAFLLSDGSCARWHGRVPVGLSPSGDPIDLMRQAAHVLRHAPTPEHYPPFTGGLVGALGWEIIRTLEDLPARSDRDVDIPDVALALASDVIAFDHHSGEVWLMACAINIDATPERADAAYDDACARLDAMAHTLSGLRPVTARVEGHAATAEPQFNLDQADYSRMVASAKQAITDGEVFQIVLSQRAELPCTADPLDVYRVLRATNPSPYMYLLALPTEGGEVFHIVGSSPETLVEVRGRAVRTFPIAGSRPRGHNASADRHNARELLADPKERAEHVMLVDLARNDLNRVCEPGSVSVDDFMSITRYSRIMHVTSTVTGELRADLTPVDALVATFPAGTLSGAPKVRAMELIDAWEPVRRGIYGGVVGYLDLQGNLDMAIAIRTAIIARGIAYVQAGAGIVADSSPEAEHAECRTKAAAMLDAIARAATLKEISCD